MDPGLGFAQLLGIAQYNQKDKTTNDKNKLLKTKIGGAKKEKRDKGKLSANVQKFLQKQEEEEKKKKLEAKKRLENLNELRSDRAKNKIAKHLKVTKSANKAVISEAVDHKNTSVTLKGRKQCDEDDYGMESGSSAGFYEKLMSKYEADPDDPMAKFSKSKSREIKDIQGVKDRVKQSLRKEEEDSLTPGKRRKRKKDAFEDDGFIDDSNSFSKSREDRTTSDKRKREEEARRKRIENAKKAPPPMDFNSLLKTANQKKDLPVRIEKKIEKKKDSEFGDRPMTKSEKEEFIRNNESRLRREGKLPPKERSPLVQKASDKKSRGSSEEKIEKVPEKPKIKAEPGPSYHPAVLKSMPPPEKRKEDGEKSALERQRKELEAKMKELDRQREELDKKTKVEEYNRRKRQEYDRKMEEVTRKQARQQQEMQERKEIEKEKKRINGMQQEYIEMQKKMKEMEERLAAGSSSKRDVNSVESRSFPGERKRPDSRDRDRHRGGGRGRGDYRQRIESDSEEYDSEMDDFIDDSDAKIDISSEIRSIFGYDKRKYRYEDEFDDRSMENNQFSSIMREEARSARIGRMEDLEEERREEEDRKRKMMKRRR